jgi:Domain of unknown function (DUF6429)
LEFSVSKFFILLHRTRRAIGQGCPCRGNVSSLGANYFAVNDIIRAIAPEEGLKISENKVDEMVLALLWLTAFKDGDLTRAWKGHDWNVLDRLHQQGFLEDPKNKNKSVVLTEEGKRLSQQLFEQHYCDS